MKMQKISLSLMLGVLLVGCDSRIDAVNEQMANIRNQPPLPIEPAPVFPPQATPLHPPGANLAVHSGQPAVGPSLPTQKRR